MCPRMKYTNSKVRKEDQGYFETRLKYGDTLGPRDGLTNRI